MRLVGAKFPNLSRNFPCLHCTEIHLLVLQTKDSWSEDILWLTSAKTCGEPWLGFGIYNTKACSDDRKHRWSRCRLDFILLVWSVCSSSFGSSMRQVDFSWCFWKTKIKAHTWVLQVFRIYITSPTELLPPSYIPSPRSHPSYYNATN